MRNASLKQRIPCIMRTTIFGPFSAAKKGALYTGKYGNIRYYQVALLSSLFPTQGSCGQLKLQIYF